VFLTFLAPFTDTQVLRIESKTNEDGSFVFYGLPEGNYELCAWLSSRKVKKLSTFYSSYYQKTQGLKFLLKED